MKIDGRKIAQEIEGELTQALRRFKSPLYLTVILIGNNPGSVAYVKQKEQKAISLGIGFELIKLPTTVSAEKVIRLIQQKNQDPKVTGLIVQLPLPAPLRAEEILKWIHPDKDVDGLGPVNLGQLFYQEGGFLPATPAGILEILKRCQSRLSGKRIALVGFTPVVNMPLALILGRRKASLLVLQETEPSLPKMLREADIIISAVGKKHFIQGSWVRKGAILIAVGISRQKGKLFGDFSPAALKKAAYFTPVPGGVGPLTVIHLLKNLVRAKNLSLN